MSEPFDEAMRAYSYGQLSFEELLKVLNDIRGEDHGLLEKPFSVA